VIENGANAASRIVLERLGASVLEPLVTFA